MQNPTQPSSSSSTTTLYTILTITTLLFLLFFFFSPFPSPPPPPPSFSDPYLFPHRLSATQYHNHQLLFLNKTTNQSPPASPTIAYFISGSSNDSNRIIRLLFSIYHPRNQYLLHLDRSAPQKERDFLALSLQSIPVFWAAQNVNVIGKADLVSPKGSSSISSTLHGAAILLKLSPDWDWFINLSAADYPLVTQDDLLHILSYLPKDLNFVNHTSYIGWRESRILKPVVVDPGLFLAEQSEIFYGTQKRPLPDAYRLFTDLLHILSYLPKDLNFVNHTSYIGWRESRILKPVVVDPGLFLAEQSEIFYGTQKRPLPDAYRLFTGSPSAILSRKFVEFCILGTENLPRTLLMYLSNSLSSQSVYFPTVLCNSPQLNRTVVNHNLQYSAYETKHEPRTLHSDDLADLISSGSAFGSPFVRDDPVLDRIDQELLKRGEGRPVPGGWCLGESRDEVCSIWGDADVLKPGPGAKRLEERMVELLSNETFYSHQCIFE
ncbi:hypothetical protein OSB04_010260 [Centaurea solstitialis]|uniref:Uncharacterized protein n=1 Tax=Centaurea solstitialis TaxID=347529 RepID=A0AA38TKE8_9ASTR|nr:hypothetical protein OSB04_010260 [Centaurea solstitialis]